MVDGGDWLLTTTVVDGGADRDGGQDDDDGGQDNDEDGGRKTRWRRTTSETMVGDRLNGGRRWTRRWSAVDIIGDGGRRWTLTETVVGDGHHRRRWSAVDQTVTGVLDDDEDSGRRTRLRLAREQD
ncbi:hypothetical protein AALP_AAs61600U000100 [Arabis alpina]|uniref:Uncharacterized protein n=1 Tax=Arabis alpina TaxID=50452 RepID=A0A087FXZ0_ARAAL|nr:hypothetical protein AALP_AAs61600U000100 [Arabis alpina]